MSSVANIFEVIIPKVILSLGLSFGLLYILELFLKLRLSLGPSFILIHIASPV